jgi:hypothetical protein
MQKTLARVVTMVAASASVLAAQAGTQPTRPAPPVGAGGQPTVMQPRGRGGRGGQMARMPMPDSARRKEMQARMGGMLKQRFGFSDAQVTKFGETNKKFAERARLIGEQDRDVRMAIREVMLRPDSARSSQLSALLDKQTAVRHERAELADSRDKELATFLRPLQRAKLSNARGEMRGRGMGGGHHWMRSGMRPGMGGVGGMRGRHPGGDGRYAPAFPPADPQR